MLVSGYQLGPVSKLYQTGMLVKLIKKGFGLLYWLNKGLMIPLLTLAEIRMHVYTTDNSTEFQGVCSYIVGL